MKTTLKLMTLGILLQASVAMALTGNDVMGLGNPMRLGYVSGMADAIAYALPLPFCVPESVTYDQTDAIFMKYLGDFPQFRHLGAPLLLIKSFQNAFPCPTKDKVKSGIEQKF